ncbi:sucrose synthase-like [Lotus japonicus]|uniref:sucrose synthase-like n=1 Tax=Lotus japonicus TaxID=34305 RepID=UPI00258B41F7|nr:sucrose synthase-like [Lotus japonicus]
MLINILWIGIRCLIYVKFHFKEELVDGSSNGNFVLELDFEPFNASFPRPTLNKSIGNGVEFLNRHLSTKLFHDKESLHPLLESLRLHNYNGKTLMLNDRIQTPNALQHVLRKAEEFLGTLHPMVTLLKTMSWDTLIPVAMLF